MSTVDSLRVLAIFAVVIIHTKPFFHPPSDVGLEFGPYETIRLLMRFAVPFFFIISGFFWAKKVAQSGSYNTVYWSMTKKLLLLFLVWSLFYILPLNFGALYSYGILGPIKTAYWRILVLMDHPARTLFQGSIVHLWFIFALWCALTISTLLSSTNRYIILLAALGLYTFSLFTQSYSDTGLGVGVDSQIFNTRDGPFVSLLFFTMGWFLHEHKALLSFRLGIGLTIFGAGLQFLEVYALYDLYGSNPGIKEYLFGTIFYGLGVAIVALAKPNDFGNEVISKWGMYTLGIYAIHFYFIETLYPLDQILKSTIWDVFFPFFIYAISLCSVLLIGRIKLFRAYVL